MLRKIGLGVIVVIAGFLVYVAISPAEFTISRALTMNATATEIFPYINDPKKMDEWMPWKASDPSVVMTYSGPEEGIGAISSWESKGKMGTGKAEIIESIPDNSVKTQLNYTKPMKMDQVSEITLTPSANATIVTWSVTGKKNFMSRLICTVMNMEKMVGKEFEKGLTTLKGSVEQ